MSHQNKAQFTSQILLGSRSITVHAEVIHTSGKSDGGHGFIHGKMLPQGYHVEITIPNRGITEEQRNTLGFVTKSGSDSRKICDRYILDFSKEDQGQYDFSYLSAVNKFAAWLKKHQQLPEQNEENENLELSSGTA